MPAPPAWPLVLVLVQYQQSPPLCCLVPALATSELFLAVPVLFYVLSLVVYLGPLEPETSTLDYRSRPSRYRGRRGFSYPRTLEPRNPAVTAGQILTVSDLHNIGTMADPTPTTAAPTTTEIPDSHIVEFSTAFYQEMRTFDNEDVHPLPTNLGDAALVHESYRTAQRIIHDILQLTDHRTQAATLMQERDRARQDALHAQEGLRAVSTALTNEQTRSAQLHDMNVTLATQLNAHQGAPATTGQRPARMPDPEKFDGTRDKLRPFLTHLRLKLAEPNAFPDVQSQLRYTVSRLEGIALEQVTTFVTDDGINFENVNTLITHLNTCFDDPDRVGTATHKLQTLKQGNRQFSEFYAEFQRYALMSNWDNAALHATLRRAISYELKMSLANRDTEPDNYIDLANLLTRIDSRQRALKQDSQPRTQNTPAPRTQNTRPATAPAATPHPTNTNSGHYGVAPMDISAGRRKLTPEERLHRMARGLCLYCGGAGHMAAVCPVKPAHLRAAEANLAPLPQPDTPATDSESKN